MKFAFLVILFSVILASAGGVLLYKASRLSIDDREPDLNQPRHWVTRQMELETMAMGQRKEPEFLAVSDRGSPIRLASADSQKPQFILFIKTDCPCSIDAQPLFNRLAERFKATVQFVGVIDGSLEAAKAFGSQFSSAFPIVPDKQEVIIHGFQAKAGIYSALVARNGHLIKMWPGYSADLLREMNHYLAVESAVKEVPFDPEYAPKQRAAGCAYTW